MTEPRSEKRIGIKKLLISVAVTDLALAIVVALAPSRIISNTAVALILAVAVAGAIVGSRVIKKSSH